MNPLAPPKARGRLRVAQKAAEDLPNCTAYNDFTDAWYMFLHATKGIYTILEQGSKVSAQSRQWFGAKKQERLADPLLQYLFQARNDDEHGLAPITEHVPEGLGIGVPKTGFSSAMSFSGVIGPGGTFTATSLDGLPILVEKTPSHARLVRVYDRDRATFYDPPQSHRGRPLETNLPLPVARLALTYMGELVTEAEGLA